MQQSRANLLLATIAFTVSFALWGLISGLAPVFRANYHLSDTEAGLAVAVPVLLGSIGRIPMGLLTDRYGGRIVFTILMAFGIIPCLALAVGGSYASLLFWGFWLGILGSSFAVGIGFVTPWFSSEQQGTALGIFGIGNIGQSVAVFGGPFLDASLGLASTFIVFGVASLVWSGAFWLWARDAPRTGPPKTLQENVAILEHASMAWVLSAFYFLTFGCFVALGIYLPSLLRDVFRLSLEDAGTRAAGFVILATLSRPVGGWLSDRIGGERLLRFVFPGLAVLAWLLVSNSIVIFTVGALGGAILLGLGNGAVFKLVPRFFEAEAGTVSGLVGAAGGIGGFFPPIVLGFFRDRLGNDVPGFALLSAYAVGCAALIWLLPAFSRSRGRSKPV